MANIDAKWVDFAELPVFTAVEFTIFWKLPDNEFVFSTEWFDVRFAGEFELLIMYSELMSSSIIELDTVAAASTEFKCDACRFPSVAIAVKFTFWRLLDGNFAFSTHIFNAALASIFAVSIELFVGIFELVVPLESLWPETCHSAKFVAS